MSEEREPTDERDRVAARLRDGHRLAEPGHARADVAEQEGDESEFTARAIRPSGVAESFGDLQRFRHDCSARKGSRSSSVSPLITRQRRRSAVVALDDRVFEILGEALRDVRNGQPRKVAAESIDFRIQRVPTIAARGEEPLGLSIERRGTSSRP